MDKDKLVMLLVTLATVVANLIFALTGLTHTVTCNIAAAAARLTATAYAATMPAP